uniref:nicotinate-nucleotide--dimethylbenzimidazole phosphoribosyltransferase n=1 Tax=Acidisphaera rubrifaciens TaxID=50715 RepID=UPI000A3EA843
MTAGPTPLTIRSLADLRRLCAYLPPGDEAAAAAVAARQGRLTKPPGSLGRLETLA